MCVEEWWGRVGGGEKGGRPKWVDGQHRAWIDEEGNIGRINARVGNVEAISPKHCPPHRSAKICG